MNDIHQMAIRLGLSAEWIEWYRMSPRKGGPRPAECGKPSKLLGGPLTRNPTLKVLSSMRKHGVRSLLMGGQACVFYGAAEFSRNIDFALMADE